MSDWTTPSRRPVALRLPAQHWFARHWRGELSLPVAWWINSVLVGLLMPTIAGALLGAALGAEKPASLPALAAAQIALWGAIVVVQGWSGMGTLRSSLMHARRGGRTGWAVAAALFTAFGLASQVASIGLAVADGQAEDMLALATGRDAIPPVEVRVSADGRTAALDGPIGSGSAQRVAEAFARAPDLALVQLRSPGGRLVEAELIAREIRHRALDTAVATHCESACTLVLLAGHERSATPQARVGFHRARSGDVDQHTPASLHRMGGTYRDAGVTPEFVARILSTPANAIWYPTAQEMLDGHVLTRLAAVAELDAAPPAPAGAAHAGTRHGRARTGAAKS